VSPVKPGRLVFLNEARMVVDGRVAVVARAWHIAPGPKPPVETPMLTADPLPERESPFAPEFGDWGYGHAIEWRSSRGDINEPGEAHVWTRVRMPLIDGVEINGQDRALIVADSANGLSAVLPMDKWLSIPPTMTTTLLRPADGEWVHLAAATSLTGDGLGLSSGILYDQAGKIGEVAQPLVVRAR
jgi:Thioesterase-like superfamily